MSEVTYIVWDAGKEKADTWVVDTGQSYGDPDKKPSKWITQKGLSASAVVHTLCDNHYGGRLISPGGFEHQFQQLLDSWARKCSEADIEVAQPVVWTAVTD